MSFGQFKCCDIKIKRNFLHKKEINIQLLGIARNTPIGMAIPKDPADDI